MSRVKDIASVQRRVSRQVTDRYLKVPRLFDHIDEDCVNVEVVADHVLDSDFLPVKHVEETRAFFDVDSDEWEIV